MRLSAKSGFSHSLFFTIEKRGMDVDTGGKNAFKPLRVIVSELGYDCVGIELVTEGKAQFLRVFIDMVGGISVRDCETVSKALGSFLDEHPDLVPGKFFLEVSSPGIERPLFDGGDYVRFTGRKARLRTRIPVSGKKSLRGTILSAGDDSVTFELETPDQGEERVVEVPFAIITRGNLVFEEKADKGRSS